jgi:hypothetical protein
MRIIRDIGRFCLTHASPFPWGMASRGQARLQIPKMLETSNKGEAFDYNRKTSLG